ncbi:MAG: hypothetical protein RLZZ303_143 [Candidatus Hydrogenedentota bacterium]|jgi:outer membrane protein TolC
MSWIADLNVDILHTMKALIHRSWTLPSIYPYLRCAALAALLAGGNSYSAPPEPTPPEPQDNILAEAAIELATTEDLLSAVQLAGEHAVTLISLDEVIALALKANPGLLVAEFEPRIAEERLQAARAEFDPRIGAGGDYRETQTDTGRVRSLLQIVGLVDDQPAVDADSDGTSVEAGLSGKLPTGLSYEAVISQGRESRDVDALGADVDVDTDTIRLSLTQPLLRGVGIRLNRAEIRKAEIGSKAADAALYLEQQETAALAIAAYWDLVGAYAGHAVRRSAVDSAERLLADTRERNELGAVSNVEVLTAQSGVARRQNELITAIARIGSASDRLKAVLDLRDETGLTTEMLAPDALKANCDLASLPLDADVDTLISTALARRPEMHLADADRRIAALTVMQRRNARLPQLDAVGEIGQRDMDQDYDGIFVGDRREDTDYWGVGLRGSIPLGNRRARAQAREAELDKQAAEQSYRALETAVMEDVRQALRALRASAATVQNARKTARLEEVRLQAERERFLFGDTTALQVLLVQDDVIAEQTRLAVAESELLANLANLQRAEGTLLESLGQPPLEAWLTSEP